MTTNETCSLCDQPHPWPDGTTPKHPFTRPGGVVSTAFMGPRRAHDPQRDGKTAHRGAETSLTNVSAAPWPFDPVLRQALIDKGVLTPDDLRTAEDKIRAVSAVFNQGGSIAEPTEETRRG